MEIPLDITLADIQSGTPRNAFCCAVAKSLARTQPGLTFKVTQKVVTLFTNEGQREAYPSIALQSFIAKFDSGASVVPTKSSLYFFEPKKSTRRRI